jgi:GST-like protein
MRLRDRRLPGARHSLVPGALMSTYVLYGNPGWGSAIVEAQLAWYGLPFRVEETGDLFASHAAREALRSLNPVSQVPTLVLPDGQVMTESAAITLHLADLSGRDDLVPGAAAPQRAAFLRWLVFLVANIYPTFTYADDPSRFVKDEAARAGFRAECDAYAQRLWLAVEAAAGAPWFLGQRLTALDIYFAVMTRWRPRRDWFAAHAPRVLAAGERAAALEPVAPVMARNFKG